jgi:hypothetical protein
LEVHLKWFRHFTRAHEDRAIEKLVGEFGVRGYGLYFYCLEVIAGCVEATNISFELEPDAEILARRLSMDTLEVERIMHRCIELNLFEIAENGRITCMKMAKFLDTASTSNPEIRKIIKNSSVKSQEPSRIVKIRQEVPDQIRLEEIRLEENKNVSLYKYLQNRHRHYAIDICGYSDEQYRDANNWGQFGKSSWPAIKDNTERWVDCVLSAAYSDKWCNGPKGKFSVNAIFSPKVLSILGPEIDKRMAECDTTEAKASADKVADDKYRADCEAVMAEWTPERRNEYDDAIAEREALYRKLQGDKA